MTLSQSLAAEVTTKGVYVQAVLPAATRTEIYERAGGDISKVPNVMEVEDLVDAALVGFDRRELVTIPPVPDVAAWEAFEQARWRAGVRASATPSRPRATAPEWHSVGTQPQGADATHRQFSAAWPRDSPLRCRRSPGRRSPARSCG